MNSFVAWYKPLNEYVRVYDIRYNKNGYPQFLVYQDRQWRLVSAKHFKPIVGGGMD